ncbi:MAG: fibronectin type III domain-containing protein, partial [Acidimicrobiia bacterium]
MDGPHSVRRMRAQRLMSQCDFARLADRRGARGTGCGAQHSAPALAPRVSVDSYGMLQRVAAVMHAIHLAVSRVRSRLSGAGVAGTVIRVMVAGLGVGVALSVMLHVERADAAVPSAPSSLAQTQAQTSGAIAMSFAQSSNGGRTITNYQYSTDGGATFCAFSPSQTSSPVTITLQSNASCTGQSALVGDSGYAIQLKAVNADGVSAAGSTATSEANNGIVWTSSGSISGASTLTDVASGGGLFVAGGINSQSQASVWYSTDRSAWTALSFPAWARVDRVQYLNGKFYAIVSDNANNGAVFVSSNPAQADQANAWTGLVFGNAACGGGSLQPVAVAVNGSTVVVMARKYFTDSYTDSEGDTYSESANCSVAYQSTNSGASFTSQVINGQNYWGNADVTFGNGVFVAITPNGIMTSSNGSTWTLRSSSVVASYNTPRLAYGNGMFLVDSGSSGAYRSADNGTTWTQIAGLLPTGLTYDGNRFVGGVASSSKVYTSADGVVWQIGSNPSGVSGTLARFATNGTDWIGYAGTTMYRGSDAFVATAWSLPAGSFGTGGNVSLIAGTGSYGFSGDGGQASSAQFAFPDGVAVDPMGNVYIADNSNRRVRKITNGVISTFAGTGSWGSTGDGGSAVNASLVAPFGVAVDRSGNVFISDLGYNTVRRVARDGIITTIAGNGSSGFSGDGGPATSARLNAPSGLAVDSAGNIYIADQYNHRVRKLTPNGANPPSYTISTVAGSASRGFSGDGGSAADAGLNYPKKVTLDAAGNLYIADTSNARVRKVSNGVITTIAGTGDSGPIGDGGLATNARLVGGPRSVAVDRAGNVVIATVSSIRRIGTDGVISTVSAQWANDIAVDGAGNLFGVVGNTVIKISAPGANQLLVNWSAPSLVAGAPTVSSYDVRYYPTSSSVASATTLSGLTGSSTSLNGLIAGSSYYVEVRSNTALTVGSWSGPFMATTVPSAPSNIATSASLTSVTVNWNAPANAAPVSNYVVSVSGGALDSSCWNAASAQSVEGTATSFAFPCLQANTVYYFQVQAVNAGGVGAASSWSSAVMLAAPPLAPTGTSVGSPTSSTLTVNWSAPTTYAPIQRSRIWAYTDAAGTMLATGMTNPQTLEGAGTSYEFTGLGSSTAYYFKVASANPAGEGPQSSVFPANSANSATLSDRWFSSIAFGNGIFVALSYNSLFSSPDGVTWTLRQAGSFYSVRFGGGTFVAVGEGPSIATSANGVSWTARTVPAVTTA